MVILFLKEAARVQHAVSNFPNQGPVLRTVKRAREAMRVTRSFEVAKGDSLAGGEDISSLWGGGGGVGRKRAHSF